AEGDTLRLPAGAVNADHTDRLLGGNLTSLVQRRQIRRRHRQPVCQPNSALRVTRSHTSIPNTKRHSPTPPTGTPPLRSSSKRPTEPPKPPLLPAAPTEPTIHHTMLALRCACD